MDEDTRTPPTAAVPQRLTRARRGRVLGGVALGLARHLGVDVTLVRIVFVLVALLQGIGLVAYGLLWLLVPSDGADEEGGEASPSTTGARGTGFWIGLAMLVVGALWLIASGGPLGWFAGGPGAQAWLLPLALIGFGVALWVSSDRAGTRGAEPDAAPPSAAPAAASPSATGPPVPRPAAPAPHAEGAAAVLPPVDRSEAGGAVPPPPPRREHSPLGRVTLGLALLVMGALWLLRRTETLEVEPVLIVAAGLLLVAAGLLVGSLWGRARWLILVGALLTPVVTLVAVGDLGPPVWGSVGQSHVTVPAGAPAQLLEEYELSAGELRLDLSVMELEEDAATRVGVGAGEASVVLPDDLSVVVDARSVVGELHVLGEIRRGIAGELRVVDEVDDGPTLTIEARVGAGRLVVRREGGPPGGPWSAPSAPAREDAR